jgi:hypothetical protein
VRSSKETQQHVRVNERPVCCELECCAESAWRVASIAGQKTHPPPPVLHKGVGELWHFRYTKRENSPVVVFLLAPCVYVRTALSISTFTCRRCFILIDASKRHAHFDSLDALAGWRFIFLFIYRRRFYHIRCNQIHYQPRSAFISTAAAVGKFNIHSRRSECVFGLIIDLGVVTEMKILHISEADGKFRGQKQNLQTKKCSAREVLLQLAVRLERQFISGE